jgi:hypothetical protein
MKQDKNKIREPYSPGHTSNPPQIIDPGKPGERNEQEEPVENQQSENNRQQKKEKTFKKSGRATNH